MYHPKFCCECGERILREKWRLWTSRRYCDNCAKHYQKKQIIAPIIASVALLGGGLLAGRSMRSGQPPILEKSQLVTLTSTPERKQKINSQQNINAQTNINAQQTPSEQPAYYCGARTQKGMPCMRRVRGPVRCWQHEGKPAMMPQEKLLIKEE